MGQRVSFLVHLSRRHKCTIVITVYANYIGPSVMTDADCKGSLYVMTELLKMTDAS